MTGPTAATRLVALLGDPVSHSLSPIIQNAAFRAAEVDGVYLTLRCDESTLPDMMRGIAAAGGAGNVTVPHKRLTAELLDDATAAVRRTGACNTFWEEDGRLRGDNTDVAGFRAAAEALVGSPSGARVLLLGAGGAARAALCALLDDGAAHVSVRNRTPARARAMGEKLDSGDGRVRVLSQRDSLAGERFDLVVNATSLGLNADDPLPLDLERTGGVGAALDLVYARGRDETAWVRHARDRGVRASGGLEMLVRQGAASFERWWDRPAPLDAMRRALGRPAEAPGS